MYYVYSYGKLEYEHDDEELIDRLWEKIVSEGHGKFVQNKEWIFSTEESCEIDGILIESAYTLEDWVEDSCCDESTEFYEKLSLSHYEIMQSMLGFFYNETMGTNGFSTYADMVFNSENPMETIYRLLDETALAVLEDKMEEIKNAIDVLKDQIASGSFSWK